MQAAEPRRTPRSRRSTGQSTLKTGRWRISKLVFVSLAWLAGSEVGEVHVLAPRAHHFTPISSLHLWVVARGDSGDVDGRS